jgi:hypothetical protein
MPTVIIPFKDAHGRLPLTDRQAEVYRAIVAACLSGRPPTYRDLMAQFGWGSTVSVTCHVKPLVKKGWVVKRGGRGRRCSLCPRVPELSVSAAGSGLTVATTGPVTLPAAELVRLVRAARRAALKEQ